MRSSKPPESQGPGTDSTAPTPHDQLIKTVLEAFFFEFLELLDPAIAERIDPRSFETLDKEIFTDLPAGDRREVDLLVRARLLDDSASSAKSNPRLFLVHVEIEATFRRVSQQRIARYYFLLKSRFPGQPILPIALFLKGGPKGPSVSEWAESVAGFTVCRFQFLTLGLSRDLAERHLRRSNPLGWGFAALMRSERFDNVARKLECLQRIARAELDEARRFLLLNIVETYLELTNDERERYNKALECEVDREVKAMQLTWEEKHYYRGRDEGRLDGAHKTLLRQIEHRLGPISEQAKRRLTSIRDERSLEALATQLLDAKSLADLGLDEPRS